ncbi:hypothetical protein PAPHI01_1696 [Pancytospora philotis]|nr:hypothetical protein PAPHI01_1696 [Pancytospora philotis]
MHTSILWLALPLFASGRSGFSHPGSYRSSLQMVKRDVAFRGPLKVVLTNLSAPSHTLSPRGVSTRRGSYEIGLRELRNDTIETMPLTVAARSREGIQLGKNGTSLYVYGDNVLFGTYENIRDGGVPVFLRKIKDEKNPHSFKLISLDDKCLAIKRNNNIKGEEAYVVKLETCADPPTAQSWGLFTIDQAVAFVRGTENYMNKERELLNELIDVLHDDGREKLEHD